MNAFAFYTAWAGSAGVARAGSFVLPEEEALVVNSRNDFELALVLKKKEINGRLLKDTILKRVQEKGKALRECGGKHTVCMVGHSQIDEWQVKELAGYAVRNCGISGISSWEYDEYILKRQMLGCGSDVFLVMHGTNDIVYGLPVGEMVKSIQKTIDYVREHNPGAALYCLPCLHVNGRLDRSNREIDRLNAAMKEAFRDAVCWVETEEMDDEFGNLKNAYTRDGLHLSAEGYGKLEELVEKTIRQENS